MELIHDWRSFQSVFYPHRRSNALRGQAAVGPVWVVADGDTIVTAFAEQEDLSDWIGASLKEIQATQAAHRRLIRLDRAEVDKSLQESLGLPHFYDQVEYLRDQSKSSRAQAQVGIHRHFLLEAIQGWWSKVLPSSFGLYVHVEGKPEQSLLLVVRRGAFEGFLEPDLSSLGANRKLQPQSVVKYLSEKYLVPVQGVFVSAADWERWSKSQNPWREVAQSVRANHSRLVPFRWGLAMLLSSRAFLGL